MEQKTTWELVELVETRRFCDPMRIGESALRELARRLEKAEAERDEARIDHSDALGRIDQLSSDLRIESELRTKAEAERDEANRKNAVTAAAEHNQWVRAEDAESAANQLRAEVERLRADNVCDACAGTGTPVSGLPCMCGGSGLASDAMPPLREALAKAEAEVRRLNAALHASDRHHIKCIQERNRLSDENEKLRVEVERLRAEHGPFGPGDTVAFRVGSSDRVEVHMNYSGSFVVQTCGRTIIVKERTYDSISLWPDNNPPREHVPGDWA